MAEHGTGYAAEGALVRAGERDIFYSNCWMWALWTVFRKGGFLITSKSEWGWWPHVMWSPDLSTLYQFEPEQKKRRRLFPPFVYRGYIKRSLI